MIVRVLEEEPEEVPASSREHPPRRRRGLLPGVLGALGLALLVVAQGGGATMLVEEVPSGWGDVPMTCDTLRLEQDGRAIERFTCRAVGGRGLPSGLFESPEARWSSDITGQESRRSRIRISRDGKVEGWATY